MSFEYYTQWWIKSRKDIEKLVQRDEDIRKKAKTMNDRNVAMDLIGGLYVRYCMAVQDLCNCLDQMAQPQKRVSIKKVVDSACIRLNELNDELRKIDISEYHYVDGNMVELKLVPYDIEILHPCLFHHRPIDIEEMWQKIKNGEKIFVLPEPSVIFEPDTMDEDEKPAEGEKPAEEETSPPKVKSQATLRSTSKTVSKLKLARLRIPSKIVEETGPEAEERRRLGKVIMIQAAERGRQERVYFSELMGRVLARKKAMIPGNKPPPPPPPEVQEASAGTIERVWRGFQARKVLKTKEDQRRLLMGMTEPSWKSTKEFEIFEENLDKRRQYRDQKLKEYIEAIDKEKARILRVVAPGLLEDIEDEIREWFHEWYVDARTFDNYPPEEKGGTVLVVRGETLTPKEYLDEYDKKLKEKAKAGGDAAQKEKEKKEKAKKEEEKKKKEAEKKKKEAEAKKKKKKKSPGDFEYEYGETLALQLRNLGEEELRNIWDERNDFDNPEEKYYLDMITEQQCYEIQLEVRKQADELMRIELDLLQEALAADKGKKYKKKKQKKKKGKKKGKKDLTANRTTEDLFQELVDNGIIRTYPKVKLDEYKGDFSYKNTELRRKEFDPPSTLLDVRQAVTINCIQPLGVEEMKKPRSVLIAGARQSGKHLLANAIFYHTQCVLFDLSPEITANKYPGNKGLAMLIHLVAKMSKLLQPAIIYFDGVERIFYKKVPKNERDLDPKRVGKKLVKGIIKTIKPTDRVLVLGITGAPWLATAAKLKKAFDRVIFIPRPDYGSVYLFWRELLMPYHSVDRDFNFTSLATVTTNYPYSVLKSVVEEVLTPRRIIQLKFRPLMAQELYEVLVSKQIEPITDKEYKKFVKWYSKTPLGKERAAFNKWADGKREADAKANEKQQKGK